MSPATEKRLLQIVVAVACLVPLLAGGSGVLRGAEMMRGVGAAPPVDLDSHFRYLSGLLLGIGLAFAWCIPAIERRTLLFRTLGLIAVVGGLGRLLRAPATSSVSAWSSARCRFSSFGRRGLRSASAQRTQSGRSNAARARPRTNSRSTTSGPGSAPIIFL
jgi:hypothetical protein